MAKWDREDIPEGTGANSAAFLQSEIKRQAVEIATLTRLLELTEKRSSSRADMVLPDAFRLAGSEQKDRIPASNYLLSALVIATYRTLSKICGSFFALRLTKRIVESTELFDPDWYLQQYPDVRSSGQDPLSHYVRFGAAEMRSPNRRLIEGL